MQNTIMQKSEFSQMRDCSGFLQIRSHIIRSSTDPGLLYLAEWLCPPPPFALPKHFLLDTPMLVHNMQFILATLPMDR